MNNPAATQRDNNSAKYIFPLHRIKCIMKQDTYYAPKAEATSAMAKATEYFAEYFLE